MQGMLGRQIRLSAGGASHLTFPFLALVCCAAGGCRHDSLLLDHAFGWQALSITVRVESGRPGVGRPATGRFVFFVSEGFLGVRHAAGAAPSPWNAGNRPAGVMFLFLSSLTHRHEAKEFC